MDLGSRGFSYISHLLTRIKDTLGLYPLLSMRDRIKFTYYLMRYLPVILRRPAGALVPVIRAMGDGPFRVSHPMGTAVLGGQVLGNILEIWVRDVYRVSDSLSIGPDSVVVDLGANTGVFTVFAGLFAQRGRVIAVEAQGHLCELLRENIKRNRLDERVMLIHGIVGPNTGKIADLMQNPDIAKSAYSIAELMAYAQIDHIDFLKIDIEGSEFHLFDQEPDLLDHVGQLAMEVHTAFAPVEPLIQLCRTHGMTCWTVQYSYREIMLYACRDLR